MSINTVSFSFDAMTFGNNTNALLPSKLSTSTSTLEVCVFRFILCPGMMGLLIKRLPRKTLSCGQYRCAFIIICLV